MPKSDISRRDFFRLSAGSLAAAGAAAAPVAQARDGDRVSIVIDPADPAASAPSVAWAVDQLEVALRQQALTLRRFHTLSEAPAADRLIVASTRDMPIATRALREAGILPLRAPESLALLTTSFD